LAVLSSLISRLSTVEIEREALKSFKLEGSIFVIEIWATIYKFLRIGLQLTARKPPSFKPDSYFRAEPSQCVGCERLIGNILGESVLPVDQLHPSYYWP
jgi:hypothetical protein